MRARHVSCLAPAACIAVAQAAQNASACELPSLHFHSLLRCAFVLRTVPGSALQLCTPYSMPEDRVTCTVRSVHTSSTLQVYKGPLRLELVTVPEGVPAFIVRNHCLSSYCRPSSLRRSGSVLCSHRSVRPDSSMQEMFLGDASIATHFTTFL